MVIKCEKWKCDVFLNISTNHKYEKILDMKNEKLINDIKVPSPTISQRELPIKGPTRLILANHIDNHSVYMGGLFQVHRFKVCQFVMPLF